MSRIRNPEKTITIEKKRLRQKLKETMTKEGQEETLMREGLLMRIRATANPIDLSKDLHLNNPNRITGETMKDTQRQRQERTIQAEAEEEDKLDL